ncbi:flagellar hook-basal body complex protein [Massilia solisilvae]|uniref:Flagellar hook protein FlgE n=1 Tax=Massilia solisilvae TaxID=1811225 RepID=A0ABT2BII6_9BURK|nr:flagellar hook-basal body complex protein [Massilia solisilvae]MCS0608318.1 flagellar hook-basal body complex protein [Massilia solisilvae]
MSFDSALSGVRAINEQLETVSNNIANSGTYGFKASRANFSSVYAGEQANGVEIGSRTQNIGLNGSVQTTGRAMDAMIAGRGFFVSRDAQGLMNYSRVGIFSVDKHGKLVDSGNRRAQGYGAAQGGALGVLGDITVPTGQIPAVATTKISYVGNLSSDWTVPVTAFDSSDSATYNMVKQSVVFDSLGSQHTVSQYFVKNATANKVDVYYAIDGAAVKAATSTPTSIAFDSKGQLAATPTIATLTLTPTNGAATQTFTIDYSGTTQFAGQALTTTNSSDGYASGTFVGVELSNDGSVIAKYSNEQQQVIGVLAVATFPDESALTAVGDTSWVANDRSGMALYERPGVGLAGKLNTGALEGSNVDITAELVGLMTSQRNYQANSKVISTESAMMQALMQAM